MIRYLCTQLLRGFYFSAAAVAGTIVYGLIAKVPITASLLAIAHFIAFFAVLIIAVLTGTGRTPDLNARTYMLPDQSKINHDFKVFNPELALSLRLFLMSLVPLAIGLVIHFFFV